MKNSLKKKAVLLLSGGLDSAANLALSLEAGSQVEVKLALTVDYGQKSVLKEIQRAASLSRHYGVEHVVVDFHSFGKLIGLNSSLVGDSKIPVPESLDDLSVTQKTAKSVWVPNRNGLMISLAAAVAESKGYEVVLVGFNAEEAVTFPDNTEDYMNAMTESFKYSTQNHVVVQGLTAKLVKVEIIQKLAEINFPFEHLWSCYQNASVHCQKCESCQRLKRAIEHGIENNVMRNQILKKVFG